ncbi:RNA-binding domain-containing protein [Methanothrix sp.]|uniref:RNA-binding domain-containing protein n=1 Tax=Methanothrix sp. TaxID=90426 RepID=UPI003C718A55
MIHRVHFRAFVSVTEDEERVRRALSIFVPIDHIRSSRASGYYGNPITILEAELRRKEGLEFIHMLREQLSAGELSRLRREIPERVDEDCKLHLRLDKQAAYRGMVRLSEAGDAIDVSVHAATYPSRYEEAVRLLREII